MLKSISRVFYLRLEIESKRNRSWATQSCFFASGGAEFGAARKPFADAMCGIAEPNG